MSQISMADAGIAIVKRPPHGCGRCGGRWDGLKTCHCAGCHRTFTTITAFDAHRAGKHSDDSRHCIDPATVGLVDADRGYPCWGLPTNDRWDARHDR